MLSWECRAATTETDYWECKGYKHHICSSMISHHIPERLQKASLSTKTVQFLTKKSLWEVEEFLSKMASWCKSKSCYAGDMQYWEKRQALLGSRVTMCWSHSCRGNLWLRQFSKPQLSKFFVKQMEITWPHQVVCSSFIHLGWKKLLWTYPAIPKAEQFPGFRFFFYAKAKTKSQASNLFCCREYSVS